MTPKPPVEPTFYEQRAASHRAQHAALDQSSRLFSNLRGLLFATFVIVGGFALFGGAGTTGLIVSGLSLVAFATLVVRHAKVIDALTLEERWVRVNEDAGSRVKPKGWHDLSHQGTRLRPPSHPYADDLDLFGKGSLFQRICVAHTEPGQQKLASWLLAPTDIATAKARQAFVLSLASELELRQNLEVLALGTLPPNRKGQGLLEPVLLEPLLSWAEGPPKLLAHTALVWSARVLPFVTASVGVLAYLQLVSPWLVLALFVAHIAVLVKARAYTGSILEMLSRTEHAIVQVGPILKLLEQHPVARQRLPAIGENPVPPSQALNSLSKLHGWFEIRENGLVYPFVNLYFLSDVHFIAAFETWQHQHGKRLRSWFDCIGEMEALSSLAGLLHDEPNCCFAEFMTDGPLFEADGLGHPLLAVSARVVNDLPSLMGGESLLVTGSNMSGKSTYLRSMGLAAVLGLAGGPVCATRLRLAPVQVATSMRISDSLAGGVSHFYAELRKLKSVLDATSQPLPVFFLLDEVLHGTNSKERQIGARYVLAELLRAGALGAVSTHDYAICELEGELAKRVTLVHFREDVSRDEMTFDYKVRPGPVTEGNALRLMRGLGIEVPLG